MAKERVRRTGRKAKSPIAKTADKYALYQRSVQAPLHEVAMFDRFYRSAYDSRPLVLREDFCGTAAICAAWVRRRPGRYAIGVDLDPVPLAWGKEHNVSKLTPAERARVTLVEDDVRTARTPKADVISAQNFSFCVLRTRRDLLRYFRAVHRALAKNGIFVLDVLGGPEVLKNNTLESRKIAGFEYLWEQTSYEPIHNFGVFKIHYRFKDNSELNDAFAYHWRMWTMPEVRETLEDAGFAYSAVYWEGSTHAGKGNNIYRRTEKGTADGAWVAYVVGVK